MGSAESIEAWIGHVNLNVAEMDCAIAFYRDALGFHVTQHTPGASIVFLSYGDSPLHLALQRVPNATPPPQGHSSCDHVGIEFPTRQALAMAYQRLLDHGVTLTEAQDHGAMLSLYFSDPDGNGLEIYWTYPRDQWPYQDGRLKMFTRPLDPGELRAALAAEQ